MRGGTPDEKVVDELWKTLKAKLAVYEQILGKQKYIAGDVSSFKLPTAIPSNLNQIS